MAKYCTHCKRPISPVRKMRAGTYFLIFVTVGLWFIAVLFYRKRCPICMGTVFRKGEPDSVGESKSESKVDPMEQLEKLSKLKESGILTDAEFETQKAKLLKQI